MDLAGSERVSKTNIDGTILREAKFINLSLHYLEQVIIALQVGLQPPLLQAMRIASVSCVVLQRPQYKGKKDEQVRSRTTLSSTHGVHLLPCLHNTQQQDV